MITVMLCVSIYAHSKDSSLTTQSEWAIYGMTWHYDKTNCVDIAFLEEFRVNSQEHKK